MNFALPTAEQTLDELGDKVVLGIATAVAASREDLTLYRRTFPSFVSQASDRGILNWISDRLWAHLSVELDGLPHVAFVDKPPTREMFVYVRFRFRLKKHSDAGDVRSYPTQGALEFMVQQPMVLPGMEQVQLCAGYLWDGLTRQIGAPVISLRNGWKTEDLVWMERLAEPAAGTGGATVAPIAPDTDPTLPQIEAPTITRRRDAGDPG